MSVYKSPKKRKDGDRWGYNIYIKDPNTGKGKRITRETFKTKKEATHAERKMLYDIEKGYINPFGNTNNLKVEEIFGDFIDYYAKTGVSQSTVRVVELGMRKHFLGKFGQWYIKKISSSDLHNFYVDLSNTLKNYRSYKFYMSQFFEYTKSKDIIVINPMDNFPKLKRTVDSTSNTKESKLLYYTEDELNAVLDVMKESLPAKQYTFFLLLSKTGLRKSEALALYKEDVDLSSMRITVNKTITTDREGNLIVAEGTKSRNRTIKSPEVLPLDPILKKPLQEYVEKTNRYNETRFFFNSNHPKSKNGHLSMATPDKWLRTFFKNNKEKLNHLGVNHKINVHGFRHTFVSILTAKELNPHLIMNLTRHSTYNTTLGYTHLDTETIENMLRNAKKEMD